MATYILYVLYSPVTRMCWSSYSPPSFQNNVLIDNEGQACLTDVGVHTLLWTLTRGGEIPATFTHKPAEEIIGDEFVTITKKMDVYSFGSTAYQVFMIFSPSLHLRATCVTDLGRKVTFRAHVCKLTQDSKPWTPFASSAPPNS